VIDGILASHLNSFLGDDYHIQSQSHVRITTIHTARPPEQPAATTMAPPAAIADGHTVRKEGPLAGDDDDAPFNVELNRAFCAMPETIFQTMSTLAAEHQCVK